MLGRALANKLLHCSPIFSYRNSCIFLLGKFQGNYRGILVAVQVSHTLSMLASTTITHHLCLWLPSSDPVVPVARCSAQSGSVLLSVNLGFTPGPCDLGAEEGNLGGSVWNQGAGLQGVTGHSHCGLDAAFPFKAHFSLSLMERASVLCQRQGHRGCELPRAGML